MAIAPVMLNHAYAIRLELRHGTAMTATAQMEVDGATKLDRASPSAVAAVLVDDVTLDVCR